MQNFQKFFIVLFVVDASSELLLHSKSTDFTKPNPKSNSPQQSEFFMFQNKHKLGRITFALLSSLFTSKVSRITGLLQKYSISVEIMNNICRKTGQFQNNCLDFPNLNCT